MDCRIRERAEVCMWHSLLSSFSGMLRTVVLQCMWKCDFCVYVHVHVHVATANGSFSVFVLTVSFLSLSSRRPPPSPTRPTVIRPLDSSLLD